MSKKPGGADAFRVQLEGRLEVLEQAQAHYEELTRLLGFGWKRRLLERVALLEAVRAREPEVAEALEGVERRARQEQWPTHHPVREVVREFQTQRERLEGRARGRLRARAPGGTSSLAEVLDALGSLARESQRAARPQALPGQAPPRPREPLQPGELLLLTGQQGRFIVTGPRLFLWLFLLPMSACVFAPLFRVVGRPDTVWSLEQYGPSLFACGAALLLFEWAFSQLKRPGQFWLTQERLIWKPRWGLTVAVKLASIPPVQGGITLDRQRNTLEVHGERRLVLPYLNQPLPLLRLLHLLRAPGESVPTDEKPQVRDVLILRALRGKDGQSPPSEPGVLVFRPGYAAFLPTLGSPAGQGTDGSRLSGAIEELLRRMRAWPQAEFDSFVQVAAHEWGGSLWTHAQLLQVMPTLPLLHCKLHDARERVVEGDLTVEQRQALLGLYPPATAPSRA